MTMVNLAINNALLILLIFSAGCISPAQYESSNDAGVFSGKRPQYAGLNSSIFAGLPDFPEDFYSVDSRVSLLADLQGFKDITENYYRQPEFYPTWEISGVSGFMNPPADRIGVMGIGAYPADLTTSMGRNSEINVTVFFHSSWLVQTYQGMSLDIINPAAEYFNITIDKNELLIGPNYPKFDRGWAQKVVIRIRSKNALPRSYIIGINPSGPQNKEWPQKYAPYIGFFGGLDRPYVRIAVNVK